MRLKIFVPSLFAFALVLNSATSAFAQTTPSKNVTEQKPATTNPPAETYRPGFWQPVARFDPKQKVTLKLVNNSGVALDYDDTTQEDSEPKTVAIAATETVANIGKNAYVMVYPGSDSNQDTPYILKFDVATDSAKNIVTVTVTQAEKGFMGHRTINLQKNGGIYFY
ncbi:MAG: hypothetical protein ACRC6M_08590 [Microcystaceae cyanobacterium]